MKKNLKSAVVRLLYSDFLKSIAKPILNNFPLIKLKLKAIRDGIHVQNSSNNIEVAYEGNFFKNIKDEVESRKNSVSGNK